VPGLLKNIGDFDEDEALKRAAERFFTIGRGPLELPIFSIALQQVWFSGGSEILPCARPLLPAVNRL